MTRKITSIYDRHMVSDEITIGQYSLLALTGTYGPVGVIPLAAYMGMDRSTMSRALKPLIDMGWIETVDLPLKMLTDKRSFGVRLSTAGKRKWQAALPNWRRAQDEIDVILGQKMHQALVALIDQANLQFEQVPS